MAPALMSRPADRPGGGLAPPLQPPPVPPGAERARMVRVSNPLFVN
jgi:hypothetical protein